MDTACFGKGEITTAKNDWVRLVSSYVLNNLEYNFFYGFEVTGLKIDEEFKNHSFTVQKNI